MSASGEGAAAPRWKGRQQRLYFTVLWQGQGVLGPKVIACESKGTETDSTEGDLAYSGTAMGSLHSESRRARTPVPLRGRDTTIDWIAPPFAGHLFPILGMAKELHRLGFLRQRVISMPSIQAPAEAALKGTGIPFVPLLPERTDDALALANATTRSFGNPLALLRQFKQCVSLLTSMREALLDLWQDGHAPDLVIADSVVPSAGSAARECGARWWTSLSSIPSMESYSGTPSYLGGWHQKDGAVWRARDAMGRATIRTFKRTAGWMARKELRSLGFDAVYRKDGSEACYSDECILGLGLRELEFPRSSWPAALRFVGGVLDSPVQHGTEAQLDPKTRHALITLGTHLLWAKDEGLRQAVALAEELQGWTVHFSHGDVHGNVSRRVAERTFEHSYVPYGAGLARFDAIIHHAGTGVMYSALGAGVPAVAWPHDFDQFDQAARLVHHGLALPWPKKTDSTGAIAAALTRLVDEPEWKARCARIQTLLHERTPGERLAQLIERDGLDAAPDVNRSG